MTKEEFSIRLGLLTDELYEAYEYFTGYYCLYNKISTNRDEMNTAPAFFQSVLKAFLEIYALKTAKLYDDHDDALCFRKLRGWIEQSKGFGKSKEETQRAIQDIQSYLDKNNNTAKQLKLLRDKLLAHTDKKQVKINIWEDAGLKISDYRSLITDGQEIICICKKLIDEPTPVLGMGIECDIDYLIQLLSKGKHCVH